MALREFGIEDKDFGYNFVPLHNESNQHTKQQMKKLILLLALAATMRMNAQIVEIYKDNVLVKTYSLDEADKVVFKDGPSFPFGQGWASAAIIGKVKWVQLWADGPKFAEYNVGVIDGKVVSYGGYYCWGKSIDRDGGAAFVYGPVTLTGNDDTATKLWGDNWRMPTKDDFDKLLTNCDVTWTNDYNGSGIKGRIFTGKGDYSSNSVFFPAAGSSGYSDVYGQGAYGEYWTSTPNSTTTGGKLAYELSFSSGDQRVSDYNRSSGYSVRAVLNETK